jgi:hypothetical protein
MADLETSARALAEALDALEARLDQRLHDLSDAQETAALLRRQSRAAHGFTTGAAEDLSRAIGDLRALLNETAPRES